MKANRKTIGIVAGSAAAVGVASAVYAARRRKYDGIKMKKSIIIERPAAELFRFWRDFENLPQLVDMLESVQVLDDKRSRWKAAGSRNIHIEWDAEITTERENEMIGWRSVNGSAIETAGYVRFEPAPGGRGTLVRVAMEYYPPAGPIGAVLAAILGRRPGAQVEEALRRFKQLMETGEMARA
jgi:uncharacterized membrane protein